MNNNNSSDIFNYWQLTDNPLKLYVLEKYKRFHNNYYYFISDEPTRYNRERHNNVIRPIVYSPVTGYDIHFRLLIVKTIANEYYIIGYASIEKVINGEFDGLRVTTGLWECLSDHYKYDIIYPWLE